MAELVLPKIEFTHEHQHALSMVDAGRNILITGPAGTGKTTLLKEIIRRCGIENMLLTGPTGVSALQLQNGKTLHSALKIPVGSFPSKEEITKYYQKLFEKNKLKIIEGAKKGQPGSVTDSSSSTGSEPWFVKIASCKILIIDEISMVSAWMMDFIDTAMGILRDARHLPFGGVQVVFVGDFLQLPPVYNKKEKNVPVEQGQLAFQSPVWSALKVERILLTKVFRQQNADFAEMLNAIRKGEKLDYKHQQYLNQLLAKNPQKSTTEIGIGASDDDDDSTLFICFKRDDVKDINLRNIEKLRHQRVTTHIYKFPFKVSGSGVDKQEREEYVKDVRENLNLSRSDTHQTVMEGMRVMLVRNMMIDGQYFVNGSIGTVVGFSFPPLGQNTRYSDMDSFPKTYFPVVEFDSSPEESCTILPTSWGRQEIFNGKIRTKIEVDAIPLIPAWAITSHRAQGSTIDDIPVHIHADCMNFAEGSFYVAISRCRTFDQLSIGSFTGFKQNRQAAEFYKGLYTPIVPKAYPQPLSLKDDVFKDIYAPIASQTTNALISGCVTPNVVSTADLDVLGIPKIPDKNCVLSKVKIEAAQSPTPLLSSVENPTVNKPGGQFEEWAKKTFKRAKKEPPSSLGIEKKDSVERLELFPAVSSAASTAVPSAASPAVSPAPVKPIQFKPRVKAKRHVETSPSSELISSWKIVEPVLDEFLYNHASKEGGHDQVLELVQKWIETSKQ